MPNETFRQSVVITDVDMSIRAMCRFMVKWVIAAIPAAIILTVLGWIITLLFLALFGGAAGMLNHIFFPK